MKAGVAIDDWKLPIFHQFLTDAGYAYNQGPGIVYGTLFLVIITEDLAALEQVVLAANTEATLMQQTGGSV